MILIDEVVGFDAAARSLTAAVTVKSAWCENWVAIEFMAQTAAALAGVIDRRERPGQPARPGFLLGTRRLNLALDRFVVGKRYLVTAEAVFSDGEAASFACAIREAEGREVACATLNAVRPDDLSAFMREQGRLAIGANPISATMAAAR